MYIFNPLKLFTQFLQPKTQDFEKKKKSFVITDFAVGNRTKTYAVIKGPSKGHTRGIQVPNLAMNFLCNLTKTCCHGSADSS